MVAIGFRLEVDQPVAVLRLRAVVRREDVGRDEPRQAPDTYLEVNPNGRICLKIFPPLPHTLTPIPVPNNQRLCRSGNMVKQLKVSRASENVGKMNSMLKNMFLVGLGS